MNDLPDLFITHFRIETPNSSRWNMMPFVFLGGAFVKKNTRKWLKEIEYLPLVENRIKFVESLKDHSIELLDRGTSQHSVLVYLDKLKSFFTFIDKNKQPLNTPLNVRQALYDYAEHEFNRASLGKIEHLTAYRSIEFVSAQINEAIAGVNFDIKHTRLKRKRRSRRAISRNAEKVLLHDATKLAKFCFEITQNFDPKDLISGKLPIEINVSRELKKTLVNLTPKKKKRAELNDDFFNTHAALAFNHRVSAELMVFLAMTIQNITPTLNLKREKFYYKPLNDKYEVREYKARKGGEIIFSIPKPYKPYFENYLQFLEEYAPNAEWVFPFLEKGKGFTKRQIRCIEPFRRLCNINQIPWTPPREFRKIGQNVLMRLCSNEKTAAEYAGHGVAVFRNYYETPSLQRAGDEITRFWNENDPLFHGTPKVSLFGSPCIGIPESIQAASGRLPAPDCITPTGCIGCKHYRDEDSFEYVWNLYSFRYLKIIESSSHRT